MSWTVERSAGPAAALHARPVPDDPGRLVWVLDAEAPALVLGSTQPDGVVDEAAAAGAGVTVVRRRSGGGAVLVVPGETCWIDVIVGAGDPLWDDDVGRAVWWLGEVWVAALAHLGVAGAAHRGPMRRDRWSRLVCFAGLAPGEVVTVGDRGHKVVGISQRRTRGWARFQCAVLGRWEPARLLDLLALPDGDRRMAEQDLVDTATGVDRPPAEVVDAFLAHLP